MKIANKYGLQIELKVGEYRTLLSGEVGRISGFQYLPDKQVMFLLQDGQHRMAYPNDVLTEEEQRVGEPCKLTCPTCSKEFMRGPVAALFDPRYCSPECEGVANKKYAEEKAKKQQEELKLKYVSFGKEGEGYVVSVDGQPVAEQKVEKKKTRSSKKEEVESDVEG